MLLGDAEKCFDKLCLQDCITDIPNTGIPEKDTIVYNLNIYLEDRVKQGTINGS